MKVSYRLLLAYTVWQKDLLQCDFNFSHHVRFNQDAIEKWFAAVCAKGFNNNSSTTTNYESAVKNIAVNWFLNVREKGANCLADGDSLLPRLEDISCTRETCNSYAKATGLRSKRWVGCIKFCTTAGTDICTRLTAGGCHII